MINEIPKHVKLEAIRDEWLGIGLSTAPLDHDGRAYVLLHQAGIINHEEHGVADLPAGVYELIIERDYDPSEYQRRVID